MKNSKLTVIGLCLSAGSYLCLILLDIDLFESFIGVLGKLERFEIDELFIPLIIFMVFMGADLLRKKKTLYVEIEKIKIYKAMVYSTNHILNNFLNQMQLFKMTAESTDGFDPEILSLYDHIIRDASQQIEALSSITNIDEGAIQASVAPKEIPRI